MKLGKSDNLIEFFIDNYLIFIVAVFVIVSVIYLIYPSLTTAMPVLLLIISSWGFLIALRIESLKDHLNRKLRYLSEEIDRIDTKALYAFLWDGVLRECKQTTEEESTNGIS